MKIKRYVLSVLFVFSALLLAKAAIAVTPIDNLDVTSTFKIAGVDKTKVVVATGTNTALAFGVKSITGSSTFSTGLGTVTAVFGMGDTTGADVGRVTGTSSGANATLKVYGVGTTTLSGTAAVVNWLAIGTP